MNKQDEKKIQVVANLDIVHQDEIIYIRSTEDGVVLAQFPSWLSLLRLRLLYPEEGLVKSSKRLIYLNKLCYAQAIQLRVYVKKRPVLKLGLRKFPILYYPRLIYFLIRNAWKKLGPEK